MLPVLEDSTSAHDRIELLNIKKINELEYIFPEELFSLTQVYQR
jgi:hypothetical protein